MNKKSSYSRAIIFISLCIATLCCSLSCTPTASAQERVTLQEQLNNVPLLNDTITIISYIDYGKKLRENNNDSAVQVLYTALQNSKRLVYPRGIKQALTALANVYVGKGKYEEAIQLYQSTIKYCHNLPGLYAALPAMYNNLANVYIKQGNYDKAIEHYKQAIVLMDRYKTNNTAEILNNLGGLLIQLRKYDHVAYYLDKAEQAAMRLKDSVNLIAIYGNKGSYFFETGQWDTSVYYAQRALTVARMQGLPQMEFNTLLNLGELYRRGNQPEQALQYLLQARSVKGNLFPYYSNHLLTILGSTYLDMKQYGQAEAYFREALKDAVVGRLNKNIKKSYEGLSAVYQATGNYKASLENYKAFRQMEDSMEQADLSKSISEWDLKFRTSEKDKKIIQNQLEIAKQKSALKMKNIWIACISAGTFLLALLLISFYRSNKNKRRLQAKQISLMQQQQEIEQLKAIMKGEERERERMARELHDGIGGMLAAIKMNLSAVTERQAKTEDKDQLNKVLNMLQDTSAEVRRTSHNLLPDILTQHRLEEALLIYCEHINLSNALEVHFQYHAAINDLDKAVELFLYRITQELLHNILKHAKATTAWLMIKQLNNKLSIIAEDNGTGFDPQTTNHGYGLLNLQYRVRSLQGTIDIQSNTDRGTTIHIEFDMEKLQQNPTLVR